MLKTFKLVLIGIFIYPFISYAQYQPTSQRASSFLCPLFKKINEGMLFSDVKQILGPEIISHMRATIVYEWHDTTIYRIKIGFYQDGKFAFGTVYTDGYNLKSASSNIHELISLVNSHQISLQKAEGLAGKGMVDKYTYVFTLSNNPNNTAVLSTDANHRINSISYCLSERL